MSDLKRAVTVMNESLARHIAEQEALDAAAFLRECERRAQISVEEMRVALTTANTGPGDFEHIKSAIYATWLRRILGAEGKPDV